MALVFDVYSVSVFIAYMFNNSPFLSVRYAEVEFTGVWNAECAADGIDCFTH